MRQQLLGPHVGLDGVEHDADRFHELIEQRPIGFREARERGQLHHGVNLTFEEDRQHDDVERLGLAEAGGDLNVVVRDVRQQNALLLERRLTDDALADAEFLREILSLFVCIRRCQLESRLSILWRIHDVENAVRGPDHRRELAEDQLRNGAEVLLPLHHPRELREVGLEPILLVLPQRGLAQRADHLVDVVLQRCDFALRLHCDRSRQVACRHCRRDFGDRAHLRGQIGGQLIDVVGEIAPCARCARNVRASAQLSFDAHFARHGRDLIRESRESVDHVVDRVRELRDLAA